jgi:predicted Zn-dependent protease with MMP-like domain
MPAQHHIDAAWKAYRQAKPQAGIDHAWRAVEQDSADGESWYALACNLERAGRLSDADKAFVRAARAPARAVGAPWRVTWARFQRSVKAAADALPPEFRAALSEITLVSADYAEPYLIEDCDDPELLGLFEGATRAESGSIHGMVSPRIHLWRRTHEHATGSAREFDAEVAKTLHHELGHYLGYDEGGLERLGLG